MAFAVFADGSANLPHDLLGGIQLLPCEYTMDGLPETYNGSIDTFDGHAYYDQLRNGHEAKTSLINPEVFFSHFSTVLEKDLDIIYISMSSGISGTYQAACSVARELMESHPGRFIHIVDSFGCGFGNGILAIEAAKLSSQDVDVHEAAALLEAEVPHVCQYFTVDNINHLKRTGRVSGITAAIAAVLNIKPILYGDSTGHIISCATVRGRKKSIEALAQKYAEKHAAEENPSVFISHGDCPDDAQALARLVQAISPNASIRICQHEPFSGAHVGPGMLGLFFRGTSR